MGNKQIIQKNVKLPSKKTMNLYQIEITDNSWQKVIPYAILIIVIVAAFAQFGIFQRISQLNQLSERVSKAQVQLNGLKKSIEDYDDVKTEYMRYTDQYMLNEERQLVDRMSIISLIADHVSNIGGIKGYTIADNTVSLEIMVDTLDDVRRIRKQLEAVDWVGNITVNTAAKNVSSTGSDKVVASIVFDVVYQSELKMLADVSGTAEAASQRGG